MKITYISNSTIPSFSANSIQIMKMCQAMVQKRFEVELLVPRRRIAPELQHLDLCHHYGIQSQFQIRRIFCKGRVGEYIYSLLATLKAIRTKPDIIYTRDLLVAVIAARAKIPVICELHQMPGGFGGPFYFRLFLSSSNPDTVLVVISEGLKQDLLSVYYKQMNGQRIVVAADGIDMERFNNLPDTVQAREKLGLKFTGLVAGYAGHFYPGKGIELVLSLAHKCCHMGFFIIGGQPDDVVILKSKVNQRGLKNVFVQGFVPNMELPLYLAACDVLLLPNQRSVSGSSGGNISRWTSPLKLFEYMATGRLIISSDLPVLREILNENNAVLLEPEDIEYWQRTLERAQADVKWRFALGQQARHDVQRYSWRKRVRKVIEGIKV